MVASGNCMRFERTPLHYTSIIKKMSSFRLYLEDITAQTPCLPAPHALYRLTYLYGQQQSKQNAKAKRGRPVLPRLLLPDTCVWDTTTNCQDLFPEDPRPQQESTGAMAQW